MTHSTLWLHLLWIEQYPSVYIPEYPVQPSEKIMLWGLICFYINSLSAFFVRVFTIINLIYLVLAWNLSAQPTTQILITWLLFPWTWRPWRFPTRASSISTIVFLPPIFESSTSSSAGFQNYSTSPCQQFLILCIVVNAIPPSFSEICSALYRWNAYTIIHIIHHYGI